MKDVCLACLKEANKNNKLINCHKCKNEDFSEGIPEGKNYV
jgi:hypothetical protein